MADDNRTCKATLYVESAGMLIPRALKNLVMKREAGFGATTGHAFFGITDETGKETVYGFHSATAKPENKGLPLLKTLPMIIGGKVQGVIMDDSKDVYDDKLEYRITRKQFDNIRKYAEKVKANPPNYDVFSSNCVIFAYKSLKKANLKLPPQPLLYMPASATISIRILEAAQKTKQVLGKAAAHILGHFSATRKISKNILTELKKKPKMKAYGVKTVVGTLANMTAEQLKKLRSGSSSR